MRDQVSDKVVALMRLRKLREGKYETAEVVLERCRVRRKKKWKRSELRVKVKCSPIQLSARILLLNFDQPDKTAASHFMHLASMSIEYC